MQARQATAEGRLYHINIRKPMLREGRQEFARHLNVPGIPAKATRRAELRGLPSPTGAGGPMSGRGG